MPNQLGKQAVVVGAGMGGLAAARALADHFDGVIVLENDALPATAVPRPGTPQSKHLHALLAGGLKALTDLFPGFEESLRDAGAVPLRECSDFRRERLGYDPSPQPDLGLQVYSMSRPLIEATVRRKLTAHSNVELRERCRATRFVSPSDSASVGSILCEHQGGRVEEVHSDLVTDATGHGLLTLKFLASLGQPAPEETTMGVDIGYASVACEIPDEAPSGWKALSTYANPPQNRRSGYVFPVEGNVWMVTLGGRYSEKPTTKRGS